jgi:hypothetical protein
VVIAAREHNGSDRGEREQEADHGEKSPVLKNKPLVAVWGSVG